MNISEAEQKVMQVLWQSHPQSAEAIAAALAESSEWRPGTIKTLINRLLKKDAISAEPNGRRYLYSPAVAREDCVFEDSRKLLERWFDGELAPLVAHFARHRKLSASERQRIQSLLEELDDED